jgi:outer membrane protein insertion porin family
MDLAAGWDLFRIRIERRESSFEEENLGGGLRAGYDISEYLRQTWRYNLTQNKIENVDDDASEAIKQQEGESLESVIGQELMYDRRNARFDPTEGYYIRLRNDFAGLGGDVRYMRQRLGGGYYWPLTDDFVLGFNGEIGNVSGIGDDVRITDAFFVGGANLRGFETAGIGPRDEDTDDALGGNRFATASVEFSFPLPLPEEYPIRGRLFSDFGTLFATDAGEESDIEIEGDDPALRVSAGAGLTWRSPFGPLAVDFALPVLKEEFDKTEFFRFSVGTQF